MNALLETFLKVSETGSFTQAAVQMFLSTNAVKKRISQLEEETGLVLFDRSNQGVKMTPAGHSFYEDVKIILHMTDDAVKKSLEIQRREASNITFGMMSTFRDCFLLTEFDHVTSWYNVQKTHIVHYGNTLQDLEDMLKSVGVSIDIAVDVYDEELADRYGLKVARKSDYSIGIGVARSSLKTTKSAEKIAMLYKGRCKVVDEIRQKMKRKKIHNLHDLNAKDLNECITLGVPVLIPENIKSYYPFFQYSPLEDGENISFGLYYKEDCPQTVTDFIRSLSSKTGVKGDI